MILRRDIAASLSFVALLAMVIFWVGPDIDSAAFRPDGHGEAAQQIIYLAIFAVVVASSGAIGNLRNAFIIPQSAMVVLLWCWLSLTWAIEPGTALRRIVLTTMIMWVIFSTIHTMRYRGARDTFRIILAVSLIINFVAVGVLPQAIHRFTNVGAIQLIGDWRGMFPHKNHAGSACAITILMFCFDGKDLKLWLRVGVIAAASFFLLKTNSKTSMGLLAPAMAIGMLSLWYDYRHRWLTTGCLVCIGLVLFLLGQVYSDLLAAVFTDEDAFTGRTQIWPVLVNYSRDHLLLGAGYGSFWNIGGGSPIDSYLMESSWIHTLANGHNGYLDVLVQLGLPGLLLVVVCFVLIPIKKLLFVKVDDRPAAALVTSLLIFCIGHNFTESSILDRDAAMQVFFMISLGLLDAHIRRSRVAESGGGKLPVRRHYQMSPRGVS